MRINQFNQPIGDEVSHNYQFQFPKRTDGRYSSLVKLNESHIDDLFQVLGKEDSRPSWTYLFENPILQKEEFNKYIQRLIHKEDSVFCNYRSQSATCIRLCLTNEDKSKSWLN